VFLAAPGTNILTTDTGGTYISSNGTSSSAAIVAGAAAQLMAIDPTRSNGVIVGRLARNADPAGTQDQTGNGRINLARALADTGTDFIEPAGAAPVGNGGPLGGPYIAAAERFGSGSPSWDLATKTISASVTGLTANSKTYQFGYRPPNGSEIFHACFPNVSSANDSLVLSGSYATGNWTVTLYAYNNNHAVNC